MAKKVGRTIDGADRRGATNDGATGRSAMRMRRRSTATCIVDGETKLKTGDLVKVKIDTADEYDLWGTVVR